MSPKSALPERGQIGLDLGTDWPLYSIPMNHRQIIDSWPKPSTRIFAEDIGKNYAQVRKWRTRNRIPSEHWLDVVDAAKKRRIPVNLEMLAQMQDAKKAAA